MNGSPMMIDGVLYENVRAVEPAPEAVCLLTIFYRYAWEHAHPEGVDIGRLCIVANHVLGFFGFERHPDTMKRADFIAYREFRLSEGVKPATVRRELAFLSAAINHAHRAERISKGVKIPMPPQGAPRTRFLAEREVTNVMRQPMPYRIRMFFIVAFATAARSKAIEELTWDRVDWANNLIDFRIPGRDHKKKRRAIVPMSDELRKRLEACYARPNRNPADPYVIGLGPRGRCSCTWRLCKTAMKRAGIDELGVCRHVARKTWASHALQNKVPLAEVAGVLADKPTTVEKHYGFILPQHLVAAVNHKRDRPTA